MYILTTVFSNLYKIINTSNTTKTIKIVSILIIFLLSISCIKKDSTDLEGPDNTIKVSGTCKDIFRNKNSPNVKVLLLEYRSFNDWSFPQHYSVVVDSAFSDTNGRFEINYQMQHDVKHFVSVSIP